MVRKKKITPKSRLNGYMKQYAPHVAGFSVLMVSLFVGAYAGAVFLLPDVVGPTKVSAAVVPGEYIVVLKDAPEPAAMNGSSARTMVAQDATRSSASAKRDVLVKKFKTKTKRQFSKAINGFSASLTTEEVAELKADPEVAYVVPDRVIAESVVTDPPQTLPTGIDRINANGLSNKGTGVNVAVIDTGIDSTHPDLAGQVVGGTNCVDPASASYEDDRGHGTHVAGTIAALDNNFGVVGVAPGAKLWSIKVLDSAGNGTWSSVICGLDFVTAHAPANNGPITVVNMSLGGAGTSDNNCGLSDQDPLHTAVCRARDAGVTVVVSAGNNSNEVSNFVPASYNDAVITVSAFQDVDGMQGGRANATDDYFATFSNYDFGSTIIDLGAPGVNIYSTVPTTGSAYGTDYGYLSGTSMAAPHVAGAAALYLATHPGASWTTVRNALVASAENASLITHTAQDAIGHVHTEPVLLAAPNSALPPLPGNIISFKIAPSSPALALVFGGATAQTVAVYALHSVTEGVNVNKISLRLTGSPSSLTKYYLYNGTSLVGSGVFVAGQDTATTTLTTPVVLTNVTDTLLTVKVDVAQVGSGKPGVSGGTIQIDPIGVQGTGQSSGNVLYDVGSGTTAGVRVFKTAPSFLQNGMEGIIYNGVVNPLAHSTINAEAGGSVGVSKLSYKIAIPAGATVTNPSLKVYMDSFETQTGPTYVSSVGSGAVVSGQPFSFSFPQSLQIPPGGRVFVELLGTVTMTANTQLMIDMISDSGYVALTTATDPVWNTSGNFVWSPNTNGVSAYSDNDWTNFPYQNNGVFARQFQNGDATTPPPPPPPPPQNPPTITSFTAVPSTISAGGNSQLFFTVENATSVSIDKIGNVNGVAFVDVQPTQTTTYVLTASNSGGSASKAVTVTVTATPADTTPPTVSFTAPANNATVAVGKNTTITANASDNKGIAKVEFFANSTLLCSDAASPYSCVWAVPNTADTVYTLKVTATDKSGNTKSATRTVNAKDTTPPTVSITSPTNNKVFARRASVTISASASDNVDLASVKFYQGSTLLCTDSIAPYTCAWTTPNTNGTYNLKAVAADASGNTTTSSNIAVKVQ